MLKRFLFALSACALLAVTVGGCAKKEEPKTLGGKIDKAISDIKENAQELKEEGKTLGGKIEKAITDTKENAQENAKELKEEAKKALDEATEE